MDKQKMGRRIIYQTKIVEIYLKWNFLHLFSFQTPIINILTYINNG